MLQRGALLSTPSKLSTCSKAGNSRTSLHQHHFAQPGICPHLQLLRRSAVFHAFAYSHDPFSRCVFTSRTHPSQARKLADTRTATMGVKAATGIVDTTPQLAKLRELMKENGVTAYVVPSDDAHASEYVADLDKRREWISGFNGSAGTALIMENEAHLFTDGRYHQQASKQLCSAWTLQKYGLPDVKNWQEYLGVLAPSSKIGIDPTLLSISDYNSILPNLSEGSSFVPISQNLVDKTWSSKPARPKEEVFKLADKYTGRTAKEKIEDVRKELKKGKGKWGIILSMLDDVAWILNLRGSDIAFNPVFFAYFILPINSPPTLFMDIDQLSKDAYEYLNNIGVLIEPYDDVVAFATKIGAGLQADEKVVIPSKTSLALASAVGKEKVTVASPVTELKAMKNETEVEGFRQCHIRDGVALTRYFSWLERELEAGKRITESEGADKLEALRKELPLFKGLSFETISSTGLNASIIHYSPTHDNCAVIDKNAIYLCDSGAQFLDGTTDTTRTLHFGTPTEKEVTAATRVLQGHIAIDTLVFPPTTTGYILDAFARRALWQEGLDYRHGTSHGVGSYLCVHEGPQGIGTRIAYNETRLAKGMTLSNEPGMYSEEDKFGVRIESVMVVRNVKLRNNFGGVQWLGFERVTMVPIQHKLINRKLLSPDEIKWINEYHQEVRSKIGDLLRETGDTEAFEWMEKATRPL